MGQTRGLTHRVLVADDERMIRQGLQVLLTRYYRDLTVVEATNGQECWDILNTKPQTDLYPSITFLVPDTFVNLTRGKAELLAWQKMRSYDSS